MNLETLLRKIAEVEGKINEEEKKLRDNLKFSNLSEEEKSSFENLKNEMENLKEQAYSFIHGVNFFGKPLPTNDVLEKMNKDIEKISSDYDQMFSRTMDDVDNDIKKAINEMLEMSSESKESVNKNKEVSQKMKNKRKEISDCEKKISDINKLLGNPNIDNATKEFSEVELRQENNRLTSLKNEMEKIDVDFQKTKNEKNSIEGKFNLKKHEINEYIEQKIKNEKEIIKEPDKRIRILNSIKKDVKEAEKIAEQAEQISDLLDYLNENSSKESSKKSSKELRKLREIRKKLGGNLSRDEIERKLNELINELYKRLPGINSEIKKEMDPNLNIEIVKIEGKEQLKTLMNNFETIVERVDENINEKNAEISKHLENINNLRRMNNTIGKSNLSDMKSNYENESSKYSDVKKFMNEKRKENKKKIKASISDIDIKTGMLGLRIRDIDENRIIGKCDFAVNKDENKIYYSTNLNETNEVDLNDFKEENVEEILKKILENNENLYQFVDKEGNNTDIKERAGTIYKKINDEILKYVENQKNHQENKGGDVKPEPEPTSSRDIVIGRKIKVVENGDEENAKEFKFSSLRYRRAVKKFKEELFNSETTFRSNDKKALFNDIAEYIDGKNEDYKPNKVVVYSLIKDYKNCSKEQQQIILDTLVELSGMNGKNHAQITIDAEDMSKRSIWKAISTKIRYNSLEKESEKFEDIIEVKGEYRPRKLRNKLLGVFKKNEALNPGENIPKRSMDGIKLSKEQINILTEISQMTPEKAEEFLKIINRSSNEDLSANYNVDLQRTQRFREQLTQRLSEQINKEEKSDQSQSEQSKDEEEKE